MFSLTAADAVTWKALVERMLLFYRDQLHNPQWGEQIGFSPDRRLSVSMLCHSLGESQIRAAWAPLFEWIDSQGDRLPVPLDRRFVVGTAEDNAARRRPAGCE